MHKNAWTVLGEENKFAVSEVAGNPVPTFGHVVFKNGFWVIDGDQHQHLFMTQSEAVDTLLESPR